MANDRIHIEYTLTFTTPFHCGTGLRVGLIDRTIVRDKDGYLYVPGSTIKGVVREYCEQLTHLFDENVEDIRNLIDKRDKGAEKLDKEELDTIRAAIASPHDGRTALWALTQPISMTTRIFGARHYAGHLFFEDARQTDESLKEYDSKEYDEESKGKYKSLQIDFYTQARLDRLTRTAITGALYTSEFGVKDFTFAGNINGWLQCSKIEALTDDSDGPTYSLLLLLAGLYMIDRLGGNKSAGKGRCRCEVDKVKINDTNYTKEQWQAWFDYLDQLANYVYVEQGGEA
jgi:CRISPR/Cas system CMR subunit Cmr4 (Cas7 group RAMP superfamily)